MGSDPGPSQRGLVGRRLILKDRELWTKHAFPFVARDWSVSFVVVDLQGDRPRAVPPPVPVRDGALRVPLASEDLRPIEGVPRERFADLVHLDPWWIFRGIGGVDRAWIDAILATNIAGAFDRDGVRLKVHDLTFTDDLARADTLLAKDDAFHPRRFRPAELDLTSLRRRGKTL